MTKRPLAAMHRIAALLLAVAGATTSSPPALAQERTGRSGIGADDSRISVSVAEAPWSSVVRVQTEAGTICTGVVVAPRMVVTAAHCLVAPRTKIVVRPERTHVQLGYARGEVSGHARAVAITMGPGFVPARAEPMSADWAVLRVDRDLPAPPLALAREVAPGTAAMLGGWQRGNAHLLHADTECRVVEHVRDPAGPLLRHDCAATMGASGGPLLVRDGDAWRVAGITVTALAGRRGGYAVPSTRIRIDLPR